MEGRLSGGALLAFGASWLALALPAVFEFVWLHSPASSFIDLLICPIFFVATMRRSGGGGPASAISNTSAADRRRLCHDLSKKVACSRVETILVSPTTGDVLVSRDRSDAAVTGFSPSSTAAAEEDATRPTAGAASSSPGASPGSYASSRPRHGGDDLLSVSSSIDHYVGRHVLCSQCQQWAADLTETHCRRYGPCGADGATKPPTPCGCDVMDDIQEEEFGDAYVVAKRGLLGGGSEEGGLVGCCECKSMRHDADSSSRLEFSGPPIPDYSWGIVRRSTGTGTQMSSSDGFRIERGLIGGGDGLGQQNGHHRPSGRSNNAETSAARANGHYEEAKQQEVEEQAAPLIAVHPSQDESVDGVVDDINLLPSFDYSHFTDGGNDMMNDDDKGPSAAAASAASHPRMQTVQEDQPQAPQEMSWASMVAGGSAGAAAAAACSPSRTTAACARADSSSPGTLSCETLNLSCGRGVQPSFSMDDKDHGRAVATPQLPQPPSQAPDPPLLMHGVPTFFPALSQIAVTKVSAHPMGSHVLLISREALLFSYGSNHHGQLGHGTQKHGFVPHPTIVTPLLENGGKTIDCAAGVNHSLVVVQTVGERVGHLLNRGSNNRDNDRSRSSGSGASKDSNNDRSSSRTESSQNSLSSVSDGPSIHHQVYGFGRNDYMKLGLNDPSSAPAAASPQKRDHETKSTSPADDGEGLEDDVLLPRSVRLGVTFTPCPRGSHQDEFPQRGVFALAASFHHSAALVRTDSDLVELYTWGKADRGALGLGTHVREVVGLNRAQDPKRIAKPTLRKRLSSLPRAVAIPNVVESFSNRTVGGRKAFPCSVALGPECTGVVLSNGKVLTFGTSTDGLLGLGADIKTILDPTEIKFGGSASSRHIISMSYGARHTVAVSNDGSTFAWGLSDHGRLGVKPQTKSAERASNGKSKKKKQLVLLPIPIHISNSDTTHSESVMSACAGLDNTVFITKSGEVLSCGRMSGRLGQGEVMQDVYTPTVLFGGLRMQHS